MNTTDTDAKLLGIQEAAELLGISVSTLRRWAKNKQLPGVRVGSPAHWQFSKKNLMQIMQQDEDRKRKSLEAKLAYQSNLFEAQKEATPDGLLIVDQKGKMISYNRKFIEMWKIPLHIMETNDDEAALAFVIAQLRFPKAFLKRVRYLYTHPQISRDEIHFKDGRIFDRYSAPVKDNKGRYYGYAWYFRDITQQRKLEKQKDEFLAIASHELKTPITSMKIHCQLLLSAFQKKGDVQAVDRLHKMDLQISKLTNLIHDLLDVTKMQEGKLQFHNEQFDFNALVNEVIEELGRTSDKHKIVTNLTQTVVVEGDRDRIAQVLTNLLSNALKYSPQSDKIIVRTTRDEKQVTLSVQDFGVGISKEGQKKVFQRFYRAEGPKQNTFPGLGLGLYISSEIISRQGGKIWLESTRGKGSTFSFALPYMTEKA